MQAVIDDPKASTVETLVAKEASQDKNAGAIGPGVLAKRREALVLARPEPGAEAKQA